MQNQNLQQSLLETNANATNITRIYLAKNLHLIDGLLDTLQSKNDTVYHDNLAIDSLSYTRGFLLILAEIGHRLNQVHNR